jgi:hypothetical protein
MTLMIAESRRRWWACAALGACTSVLYWPLHAASFLNYDDPLYVTANAEVQRGLTPTNIAWAFTTADTGTWHPLTWLSHMAVVTLAGLDPAAHHLANVALHVANAVLLLLVLERATGALAPSALAALLFAIHPLHVESVAWVAERKDVLSTFFGLLTLAAWLRYVHDPRRARYLLVTLAFAASLMAKPMLVTLPILLLLLDYWPLGRLSPADVRGGVRSTRLGALLVEKLPLFGLAAAASVVAVLTQRQGDAVTAIETLPIGFRVGHALVSYARYLGQAGWPVDLAVFYPYPHRIAWTRVAGATILLALTTGGALWSARRVPFVLVGWLWFLVSLLPVIGLVQIGMQSTADRFTYVPLIGLGIAVAWTVAAIAAATSLFWRLAVIGLVSGYVLVCTTVTARQLTYWKDDVALYRHALAVTTDNFIAHNNLGLALVSGTADHRAEAAVHFAAALQLRPAYPEAHNNLGGVLYMEGRRAEAIEHFAEALRLRPDFTAARDNLRIAESLSRDAP